ncbi:hypothetical protein [Nakamurella multipartita]|uniref:hypothetical protein n=1 Tax=Nakamurella multipartita TaxID=53461 RepID=UPI00019E8972|nr:hypothetical protein [Nakamurella multipartita]
MTLSIAAALACGVVATPAQAAEPVLRQAVSGSFGTTATGISFEPAPGRGCWLTVTGTIVFPGPADPTPDAGIVGTADGVTTALVDASCDQAQAAPPGTYADVFRSTGTFVGTIGGEPVTGTRSTGAAPRPAGRSTPRSPSATAGSAPP